jgi:hypothetical protein
MPKDVKEVFYNTYKMTKDEIMDAVYTKPMPNRFCASFSKFVYDNNVNIEYTRNIVDEALKHFSEILLANTLIIKAILSTVSVR